MELNRNDWFYASALFAKRRTLYAAIALANGLDKDIESLRDKYNIEKCHTALIKFKEGIIHANLPNKTSVDVKLALQELDPFDLIIPDAQRAAKDSLDNCLYWQDSNEFATNRWNKDWVIANEVLLVAGFAAAFTLLAIYIPAILGIATLTSSFVFLVASVFDASDSMAKLNKRIDRDVIGGRIAIAAEELHGKLYHVGQETAPIYLSSSNLVTQGVFSNRAATAPILSSAVAAAIYPSNGVNYYEYV